MTTNVVTTSSAWPSGFSSEMQVSHRDSCFSEDRVKAVTLNYPGFIESARPCALDLRLNQTSVWFYKLVLENPTKAIHSVLKRNTSVLSARTIHEGVK